MAALIGKVGIVMKGAWSSSAPYEALDAVSYNNGLYIAKQAVPANTVPTNTTYWQVALRNETIEMTDVVASGFSENSFKVYRTGNVVIISGFGSGTWSQMDVVFSNLPPMVTIAQRFYLYDNNQNPILLLPTENTNLKVFTPCTGLNGTIVYITA